MREMGLGVYIGVKGYRGVDREIGYMSLQRKFVIRAFTLLIPL